MAEQEGTPLVTQAEIDNQAELDELGSQLPTNADLAAETDDDKTAKTEGENSNAESGDEEKNGAGAGDNPPAPEVEAQAAEVTYETVDDPGEFVPGDYSFEVTVYEPDGTSPKTHKITSLDQWDELLESDPNLGSSAAVAKAFRAQSRMERGIEADLKAHEAKKAEYDQAVADQQERDNWTTQAVAELDYLVNRGDLPPMPAQYHISKADWAKPDIAKQPAVAAQKALLDYFQKENAARTKAGLAPMRSLLDAYNGYAREQEKTALAEAKREATAARKAGAARVTSSSPRPATTAPKGIAVGRTGLL